METKDVLGLIIVPPVVALAFHFLLYLLYYIPTSLETINNETYIISKPLLYTLWDNIMLIDLLSGTLTFIGLLIFNEDLRDDLIKMLQ